MARCFICNNILHEKEIKWDREHGKWDPCGACLEAIRDVFGEEPPLEEELDDVDFTLETDDDELTLDKYLE